MLACLPEVDAGPEAERNGRQREASACFWFPPGCHFAALLSVRRLQARLLRARPNTEACTLRLCTRSYARGNKSKWCMIRKCTEEAEPSFAVKTHRDEGLPLERPGSTSAWWVTAVIRSRPAPDRQTATSSSITSVQMLMKGGIFIRWELWSLLLSVKKQAQTLLSTIKEPSDCQRRDRCLPVIFSELETASCPLYEKQIAVQQTLSSQQ